ncbi:MAG: hypothetical protein CMO47_02245 [Verrucomicrobiales bacterium]|jgi:hypothetical protein|nr:hypothetical protein [Verrucomicrobiales bacterium]|tara:strand:+ start:6171 stop:6464 length:294 start_codon:yes stop_codon:yes gene_type:complete
MRQFTQIEFFTQMSNGIQRELGSQPLNELLEKWGLDNHELVEASKEQLTHKQVQKARKGRRVSANIQRKILNALKSVTEERGLDSDFSLVDLFNYHS